MNDPWSWTTVWEWRVRVKGGSGQRRAKGEKLGQLNRITIKKIFKKISDLKKKSERSRRKASSWLL